MLRSRGVDPATVPTIIDLHGSGSWREEHVAVTAGQSFAAAGTVIVVRYTDTGRAEALELQTAAAARLSTCCS
jgi:hypothetical protein